ncbi:MAG: response regulator [Mycetocola sp.]
MSIRVLIVDDQAMVRAGFAAILNAQPGIEVVGQATNGAEAIPLARREHADVVVMDIRMPVMNGIDACRELVSPRTGDPHRPRVLVLTTFDIDEYVHDALRAGASGFLLKDALPDELVAAVHVVAEGQALLAPTVTRRLIEEFARTRATVATDAVTLNGLTDREREVLTEVAQGKSNGEIASALFISEQTVKTHVSKILSKLECRDRVQAVIAAYDAGLVTPGSR